jgi:transposase
VKREREENGWEEKTTLCIVDAQSVKTTETAQESGYDAGKKIRGIKRHLAVDSQGLPHAIEVTTANVGDREGALLMFLLHEEALSAVVRVLLDSAYSDTPFERHVKEILGATVEVAKRSELHKFAVIPKRWIVERSFAWLEKCRRLWKNCERKLHTSLQLVVLAFLALLLRRH